MDAMGRCAAHPDRETAFQCLKHELFLCEECLRCRDPKLYCKHRPACPIWYAHKRRLAAERRAADGAHGGSAAEPSAAAPAAPSPGVDTN